MDHNILGYLLLACKRLNYSKEEVRNIMSEMLIIMESYTAQEAEEGFNWYSKLEDIETNTIKVSPSKSSIKLAKERILQKNRKKFTTLPDDYESEISKENKKLLNLLRSL